MANQKPLCCTCHKEKPTYLCDGCTQRFCFPHLQDHRQALTEQLDAISNDHNQFKQTFIEQKQKPQNSPFIEAVDQWERTSIETIRQAAEECRETVLSHTKRAVQDIDEKLEQLTSQLQRIRGENEFNEIDLDRLKNKLTEMTRDLAEPPNISLRPHSQALIHKMHVVLSTPNDRQGQILTMGAGRLITMLSTLSFAFHMDRKPMLSLRCLECEYHKWQQHATTVAGGNGGGHQLNQLDGPHGIWVDQNKDILIADCDNHRIVRWQHQAKAGTIVAGGNGSGNQMDQLHWPTHAIVDKANHSIIIADQENRRVVRWCDQSQTSQEVLIDNIDCSRLAMDSDGSLYVSDSEKHEVRRWTDGQREGILVAGGNGAGNQLDQLHGPSFLFVDEEQSVYVSDRDNHRVMKWRKDTKEGMIVAGEGGQGNRLHQLSHPRGVVVDQWGQIYVADSENDRVMRWREGQQEGEIVVGGNGQGEEPNQLDRPLGLSFDHDGNLYVADYGNDRVQKFDLILS